MIAKAPEMFNAITAFIQDFDEGLIEDFQMARDVFQEIINKITE